MIGRKSLRPYRPPQLLTGKIDDFPLAPETPTFVHLPLTPPPPSGCDEHRDPERIRSGGVAVGLALPAAPTAPTAEEPVALARQTFGGPVDDSPTPPPLGSDAVIECLEAAKELAAAAPSLSNEALGILESEQLTADEVRAIVRAAAPQSKSRLRKKSQPQKKKTSAPPERLSRLELHQSHCKICGYEDQDEIDEAFVSWENVRRIAEDYDIDRRAIYRHAHATGLYEKRDRNIRRALGRIVQEADRVIVTSDSVIRAAKMLMHINARGDWVNPPTHVIVSAATRLPDQVRGPARPDEGREQSRRAAAHPAPVSAPRLPELSDTPCKVKKGLKR